MDVADLLKRVADNYAIARTYADRGVVSTTFIERNRRRIVRRPFLTAFERPHQFRYRVTDESSGDRLEIWQEAPPARMFRTSTGGVATIELVDAIARATGISGGSALTIPRLLMPDVLSTWALTDIENPEEEGHLVLEGVECLGIRGQFERIEIAFWLGAEDLLVRRILRTEHFSGEEIAEAAAAASERSGMLDERANLSPVGEFDAESETLYSPRRNVDLSSSDFDHEGDLTEPDLTEP